MCVAVVMYVLKAPCIICLKYRPLLCSFQMYSWWAYKHKGKHKEFRLKMNFKKAILDNVSVVSSNPTVWRKAVVLKKQSQLFR